MSLEDPKFYVGDEVAYDDDFGVVVDIRAALEPSRAAKGSYDFKVHWPNNAVTWCWDSDLSDAEERRMELAWYACDCPEDTEYDVHLRECEWEL